MSLFPATDWGGCRGNLSAARRYPMSRAMSLVCHPAVFLVLLAACTSQAERKSQHLEQGQHYFQAGQYREAEIEFRNALQIDPKLASGHLQLGRTYLALKDPRNAFTEFQRALELDGSLRDARFELARLYLAGGDGAKAEAEARTLIEKNPKDVEARLVLVTWLLIDQKVADADEQVNEAVKLAPDSVDVQLALGRVLTAKGQLDTAQAAIERAIKLNPKSLESRITLASFFRLRQQNDKAEAALKDAMEAAPAEAGPRFQLAELYLTQGRTDDTLALLEHMVREGPEQDAAKRRLADLYLETNRVDEAERSVAELEQVDKTNLETRYLRARVRLARGDLAGGSEELTQILKEWPSFVQARYQLGIARIRENKTEQAAAELTECLKYRSDFVEARSLLAQIHLSNRAYHLAADEASRVLAVAPKNLAMRLLLSDAAIAEGDYTTARAAAQKAIDDYPDRPGGYQRMARVLSEQGQAAEGLKLLEHALEISPDAMDVLRDIILVMGKSGRSLDDRINRLHAYTDAHPEASAAMLLLSQLQMEQDRNAGIKTLETTIAQHPEMLAAYYLLGAAYAKDGRLEDARAHFEHVLEKEPTLVGAHMMIGIIDEIQGKYDAAANRYQRALDLDANFGPAANNLAWHYVERAGKPDIALELARRAKQVLPEDPNVADTLGWVLYRRGLFSASIEHLKFAADKLQDNPEVRYHLGMAYLRNGDKTRARTELTAALSLGSFSGKNEAEQALKEVG